MRSFCAMPYSSDFSADAYDHKSSLRGRQLAQDRIGTQIANGPSRLLAGATGVLPTDGTSKRTAEPGSSAPDLSPAGPTLHRPRWLRLRNSRAVLEVILQDFGGQLGTRRSVLRIHGAYYFSATDHFGRAESGNFGG
jgi:hypothetical protein